MPEAEDFEALATMSLDRLLLEHKNAVGWYRDACQTELRNRGFWLKTLDGSVSDLPVEELYEEYARAFGWDKKVIEAELDRRKLSALKEQRLAEGPWN